MFYMLRFTFFHAYNMNIILTIIYNNARIIKIRLDPDPRASAKMNF